MKKNILIQTKELFKKVTKKIKSYMYNYTEEDFNSFVFLVDGKILNMKSINAFN